MPSPLNLELAHLLRSVGTPTICNALELVMGGQSAQRFTYGTVVVMQDFEERPAIGSVWGEVNSAVHEGLAVVGVLTNGSVRDLGDLSPTFPILAGSIGPSHEQTLGASDDIH